MSASAVLKLQKVGFSIEQVEALADFMDTQAASKADLNDAKAELKSDIAGVRSEIASVKNDLKAEIAGVRSEFKAEIAEVRSDLRLVESNLHAQNVQIEQRMTIKLGGLLVVITGILLAAIRYLPPH